MTAPVESHCSRCLRPSPPVESFEFFEWEAFGSEALTIVCPDCITPEEHQAMDEDMMGMESS